MKVYHVYTCENDEPWYPNEDTAKIYGTFEKAREYANELVSDALEEGYKWDSDCAYKGETPSFENYDMVKFFYTDWNEKRIYIDEYEVE